MPHIIIEYSANLATGVDINMLCKHARDAALATGLFETGAIRVRAHACDHYAIADDHPDDAFVHLDIRIGKGRTEEDKRMLGQAVFDRAAEDLAPLLETPHLALSLYLTEVSPEASWKKNAIHRRFRKN
ncbi:5-carboxymethyl-2-hydroxymuconate Delta-isomerase [Hoeflea sp. CAU 1731]